ncbi:hypothetical protein GF376_03895 [Candidatus Peregrinibacteria bacterium]|nr:hypothetical protein [Candidatus Peregrinibacteria bacterium]
MYKILHKLVILILAIAVFGVSLLYESNFSVTEAKKRENQIIVGTEVSVNVNRSGQNVILREGDVLQEGDIINTEDVAMTELFFSADGRLRLAADSRLLLSYQDAENSEFVFQLLDGRAWLNNRFSNASVNLLASGALIEPGQSIVYVEKDDDKALIYSHQSYLYVNFVEVNYVVQGVINYTSDRVVNSLLLPQGAQVTIFKSKLENNIDTIARLLFSKLIKEFQYSVFDKTKLRSDDWLDQNTELDDATSIRIVNERLSRIRDRGIEYQDLESLNYQIDQKMNEFANFLTFSDEKIAQRNLEFLYSYLFDSQYLFDTGKKEKAQNRLNEFESRADALIIEYGSDLKRQYDQKLLEEFRYLSFVSPNDSLYGLKEVLADMYIESLQGSDNEIDAKFAILSDQINTINFHASNNSQGLIKSAFESYMSDINSIFVNHEENLDQYVDLVQQQNQLLNNLFSKYADFYRLDFFKSKLAVENAYLDLLDEGQDKYEEIQTIILQRINFLRRLQEYFLDGDVPTIDAQNIVNLLINETDKLQLPSDVSVAVSKLFNERLRDFGIFHQFLNSPGYVNNSQKGITLRDRFERFKLEQGENISFEEVRQEVAAMDGRELDYEQGILIDDESDQNQEALIDEERITVNVNDVETESINEVDPNLNKTPRVRVPRVRPQQ